MAQSKCLGGPQFNDFSQPSPAGVLHPVVGQQYNCVANVSNTSQQTFPDANVYFYWANPSLGMITGVNANSNRLLVGRRRCGAAGVCFLNTLHGHAELLRKQRA